jgi:hypothetical protein
VVQGQIQDTLLRRRHCPECGKTRHSKGHHDITIRTLFGNIELQSSRLEHCRCQVHVEKTHGAAVAHRLEDSKYLPSFGVAFTRVALEAYSAAGGPPLGLDGVGWFHVLSALEHFTFVDEASPRWDEISGATRHSIDFSCDSETAVCRL